jgi:gas vesicle protein
LLIKLVQKYKKIGDKVAGVGQQAGNFLEKNSAILGDVAGSAAMATGFGAPIGASLISAGNIGQQMGQRLKQGSQEIRDASNRVGNLVQSQLNNASNQAFMAKNNISNQIKNKFGALNSQVGMSKQQMQQAIECLMRRKLVLTRLKAIQILQKVFLIASYLEFSARDGHL